MHNPSLLATTSAARDPSVNLNLGAIGRVAFYKVHSIGGPIPPASDEFAAIAAAHAGLPRPPIDLDCHIIPAPECPNLLVLGATHHQVAYYIIANLAEQSAFTAMAGACKKRRLELLLMSDGSRPWRSVMRLEDSTAERLALELHERKNAWRQPTDLWRDKLGLLVTDLPRRFAQHYAPASACTQHSAVLASGNRSTFLSALDRCIAAGRNQPH
jgi:hypothetical protein